MSTDLEPRTTAKCIVHTSKGRVEVELWAKECPQAVKCFLTNCNLGAFDGIPFSKKLFDSVIHTDAPLNGVGTPLERNTRLRFNRRGLIGMFPDAKGSIFITLCDTAMLNDKATLLGKVVGNSFYEVIKIADGELESDGQSFTYPAEITRVEIVEPYFDNLPKKRMNAGEKQNPPRKPVKKRRTVKLVYDEEESEGDDHNVLKVKIKAAHDLLKDAKLVKSDLPTDDSDYERTDLPSKNVPPVISTKYDAQSSNPASTTAEDVSPIVNQEKNKVSSVVKNSKEDETQSEREKETLKLLAAFQKKSQSKKGKNLLTSHVLKFNDDEADNQK